MNMHDIVSRLPVATGTMNLPNGVISRKLLELMNQITFRCTRFILLIALLSSIDDQ
jgi:hypothetical protein